MSESIYHLLTRADWTTAQQAGVYKPDSLAASGFIHCSTMSQINRVANALFAGITDLVMLEIDPAALKGELRWEPGADKPDELFPHLYAPLNLEAVVNMVDFSSGGGHS